MTISLFIFQTRNGDVESIGAGGALVHRQCSAAVPQLGRGHQGLAEGGEASQRRP